MNKVKKYLSIAFMGALVILSAPVLLSAQNGENQIAMQENEAPVQNNPVVPVVLNARWYKNITAQKIALCAVYTGMALIAIYYARKDYLEIIIRIEESKKNNILLISLCKEWEQFLPYINLLSTKEQQEGSTQEWIEAANKIMGRVAFVHSGQGMKFRFF